MKILLISPPKLEGLNESKGTIPVPLLHLAAVLRQHGHVPSLLDLSIYHPEPHDDHTIFHLNIVRRYLNDVEPDMVGINCFTTLHFPVVLGLAETVKTACPAIPIAVGGAHPSLFSREILERSSAFDYVFIGEAENSIIELIAALQTGDRENISHVQSIAFRRDGHVVVTARRSFLSNLDELPEPAWDMISFPDYYADHSSWFNPKRLTFHISVPILSSRSCPFTCNFCSIYTTMGRKLRMRSPVKVADEIQMLHQERGQNYFGFIDDNVNVNKKHILGICDEIVRRGLNIEWETTCGTYLGALDDEIVAAMAGAGCVFARLPIEHGNDQMRIIVGKKLPREKIFAAASSFKRHGIFTSSMYIMGFPEDTPETLEDTRKMILDLQLDLNYVFNIIPFPGTRLFEQASRDGLFLESFDPDQLWRGGINLDPVQDEPRFFIKPYKMEIDALRYYRKIFDSLRVLSHRAKSMNKAA